jgi:mannose/cellobiose epimerase-like protein (N-acyl-D-glucosamine 2-epimerase family)
MSYRDPDYLKAHIESIIDFYHPACLDTERGGNINQFRDDGTIYDRDTKHLVGTCRFIYNYSIASIVLKNPNFKTAAAHGLEFLKTQHRQSDGGFAWVLGARGVIDGTRHCYGHAFVLLAAAAAAKAGISGAPEFATDVYALLEKRFWDAEAQLYVDEIAEGDWSAISSYRGQNANMHMCEAMLSAYEATGDIKYLDRAHLLAKRICVDLAAGSDGLVWEHFHTDWTHDWDYNRDDPKNLFRPYGYLPGHFVEWSKLLLILERYRSEPWMLETARLLFDTALDKSWDERNGGMNYTFDRSGKILDADRYYWVLAEAIAASAALALRTGLEKYWNWYDQAWSFSDAHLVDHQYGAWYRVLDANNNRYDDKKSPPSKTDYHPLGACFEVLEAMRHVQP